MYENERKQDEVPSVSSDEGQAFAARRRVIRGLASAPVALTLSNSAALANASSHQCLTNQVVGAQPNCVETTLEINANWAYSKIKIKPTAPLGLPSMYCPAFAVEDPAEIVGYKVTGFDYQYLEGGTLKTIFIDQNGNIVGNGQPYGHPLTVSCQTSFV